MRPFEIGLVLPVGQVFAVESSTPRWAEIRELVLRAEQIGFDIVWISDELLWRATDPNPQGFWEGVAVTGAVAASTSRIKVGTWILSALHRNPGLTAKVAETIDEVSGGRFVFGLGAGHAGSQAHAFGLPEDHVVGRFEEAIQIIIPLLRDGRADFAGQFHTARNLVHRPVGPRPGRIPLLIGAKGPRMLRIAALHADMWSWFVEERSDVAEFAPRLAAFEEACEAVGRDPATAGKSAGIVVEPTSVGGSEAEFGTPVRGSAEEIADAMRPFAAAGFTNVELVVWPPTPAALDAMAPVLELIDAG
jgi:alkanesulfonate monooxygenase SsuD/methylene tetrahydromethanopterin reductase-like flavin-dependent oxidoreductase (luciferase family)